MAGLASLHVNNSIHGDLKGANLFVDASGIFKLADFGIAKHVKLPCCMNGKRFLAVNRCRNLMRVPFLLVSKKFLRAVVNRTQYLWQKVVVLFLLLLCIPKEG